MHTLRNGCINAYNKTFFLIFKIGHSPVKLAQQIYTHTMYNTHLHVSLTDYSRVNYCNLKQNEA